MLADVYADILDATAAASADIPAISELTMDEILEAAFDDEVYACSEFNSEAADWLAEYLEELEI
jgi:hypothetical protein